MNRTTLNHKRRGIEDESDPELENHRWLGAARPGWRQHDPGWLGEGLWTLSAGPGSEDGLEPADRSNRCGRTGQCGPAADSTYLFAGTLAYQCFLGRRHLPAHVQRRTACAPVRLPPPDLCGG